jgi:hypothetical protein
MQLGADEKDFGAFGADVCRFCAREAEKRQTRKGNLSRFVSDAEGSERFLRHSYFVLNGT